MTSYSEAIDDICSRFAAVWPHYVAWDNQDATPPTNDEPWARVQVRHTEGTTAALGNNLFTYSGTVYIELLGPAGRGTAFIEPLVSTAISCYLGVRTPNGVWYRNVKVREEGVRANWCVVTVSAEFEYDEER